MMIHRLVVEILFDVLLAKAVSLRELIYMMFFLIAS
jgi:hypothetical protein